jgi:GTP 3',8-cyclase
MKAVLGSASPGGNPAADEKDVLAYQPKSLSDSYGRVAKKLRIQVTDRCNYSCDFCMPPNPVWLDRKEILSFEEIRRISGVLARMGVEKIRLSGGEPLVRRDIEKLVASLAGIVGIRSVSITTNGSMLENMAAKLKESGLSGVTLSLHSLRPDRYQAITGVKDMLGKVLAGMEEARRVGLPLKVNCVVRRGSNEDEIPDFVRLARERGTSVRFIEYMPFDGKRFWDMGSVLGGSEIIARAAAESKLVPLPREQGSTATVYRFEDGGAGEVCTITSMTKPFCFDCERIRLTAEGKIVPCLFSNNEYDVKSLMRGGAGDEEIASFVRDCFRLKFEGVESLIRQNVTFGRVRPMHTIGG